MRIEINTHIDIIQIYIIQAHKHVIHIHISPVRHLVSTIECNTCVRVYQSLYTGKNDPQYVA